MSFLRALRNRWKTVLVVWVLLAATATGAVFLLVKPVYTATMRIRFAPAVPLIFSDTPPSRVVDDPANVRDTIAEQLTSAPVVRAAVADPTLRGLPLLNVPDPVQDLITNISVKAVPDTRVVIVGVRQRSEEASIRITKALVRAFLAYADGSEADRCRQSIGTLEEMRRRYASETARTQRDLYTLLQRYGATAEMDITSSRQAFAKSLEESFKQRDGARDQKVLLEEQLKELQAGRLPTSMPSEELAFKEKWVHDDATVFKLREALASLAVNKAHTQPSEAERGIEIRMKALLDQAMVEAAQEADHKLDEHRLWILEDAKTRLASQLNAASSQFARLDARINEIEQRSADLSRVLFESKKLEVRLASINRNQRNIEDSLSQLDLESHCPSRISSDDTACMLPKGITDHRIRYASANIFVAFVLACCVGILKETAQAGTA